ncbi:MAG: sulfide/dihydroorotate dehydrogenase-like FAD/NAD-binding protein [Candidatus Sumerlaeota bacterium]|nr:sulfide/dihydroorotate dehydrogenase-like FAD/NAD-binding protein [Candidatus Sumerlaeota bacterium]
MTKIVRKELLSPTVKLFEIETPHIARKAQPGQFVIVRVTEEAERIPLTIADFNREKGTITIIVQEIGASTKKIAACEPSAGFAGVVGPLGVPTHIQSLGTVVCIGGGVGIACIYPIARAYKEAGNQLISIIGARSKDLLIYEKEMGAISDELIVTTDDGSHGLKGLVTERLKEVIARGKKIDMVFSVGPTIMMRFVAETTRPHGIPTWCSLNPIMVDGTGMCGGCRVSVGGQTKFACVDGPDFDAHQVDFPELMARQRAYYHEEQCRLNSFAA